MAPTSQSLSFAGALQRGRVHLRADLAGFWDVCHECVCLQSMLKATIPVDSSLPCSASVQSQLIASSQEMFPDNAKYVVVPKAEAHIWRIFIFIFMNGDIGCED